MVKNLSLTLKMEYWDDIDIIETHCMYFVF